MSNFRVMAVFEFSSDGRSDEMLVDSQILVGGRGFDFEKIGELGMFVCFGSFRDRK